MSHYTDIGVHKTLAEAHKLMDPDGDDLAFSLQQSIMNVSKLTVKTIHDELAALKKFKPGSERWRDEWG